MDRPGDRELGRATRAIGEVTSMVAGLSVCFAIVILTADAIGRHFNHPVPGGTDLVAFFMAGIVYIGMVALQIENRHLRLDLLGRGRLPRYMDLLPLLVGLASMAFIAWYGCLAAIESVERGEINDSAINFPVWPARMLVAAGSVTICVVFVLQIVALVRNLMAGGRGKSPLESDAPDLDPT